MKTNLLFIVLLFLSQINIAQENTDFDLSTPYQTVYTHLHHLQSETYNSSKAAKTILYNDEKKAIENVIKIKQILDAKGLFVVMSRIPKEINYQDSLGKNKYILFPKELPKIYLEKKNNNWYYSEETVELIPFIHKELYPWGSDMLLNFFPRFGTGKFLGLMIWQYVGFALLLLAGFIIYLILTKIFDLFLLGFTKTRFGKDISNEKVVHEIARILSLIAVVFLLKMFVTVLQFPIHFSRIIHLVFDVLRFSFFIFLALKIFDFCMLFVSKVIEDTETKMDDQLLIIFKRIIQISIVVFGLIAILNRLNINVTALITGVSVGGLAVALAAKDSVNNLIGALMIFVDKPFDIGDYIITSKAQGVVEQVGFRSTRLQASDTSIISIPNGKIASEVINNLGRRVYRRYRTNIQINYDTPPELIQIFIEGIEEIVRLHPFSLDEKTQVHLSEFNPSSLNIFLQTFFVADGWSKELRTKQNLMLEILKLAKELDVHFALPSQTIYVEKEKNNREINIEKLENKMQVFLEKYRQSFLED